jgi:hypothetical protein
MDSAASGSWENYCVVVEHVHITTLFETFAGCVRILDARLPNNWEFIVQVHTFVEMTCTMEKQASYFADSGFFLRITFTLGVSYKRVL